MSAPRMLLAATVVLLACGAVAAAVTPQPQQQHSRGLKVQPMPLPAPFAFPASIAASTREARAAGSGGVSAFSNSMCGVIARPEVQGTREFRDLQGVKLWPMFINLARAAYVYDDEVARAWGAVFARCNALGGGAAEGVGYGIAYVMAEGMVENFGITKILKYAYDTTGSCASVNKILDVAAAVITSRDVAANELQHVMGTFDTRLAACTPGDAAQKFKPSSLIKGDATTIKAKAPYSQTHQEHPNTSSAYSGSGGGAPGNKALERGVDAGRR